MQECEYADLGNDAREGLIEARVILERAYNPYSHFYVGAALWEGKGAGLRPLLIGGTNCENAAYGSCICAERSAILSANSLGLRHFDGIAIIARGESFNTTEVTGPCGSCRQMLYELMQIGGGKDLEVVLSTTQMDKIVITTIRELLPLAFGPLDLDIDLAKYRTQK